VISPAYKVPCILNMTSPLLLDLIPSFQTLPPASDCSTLSSFTPSLFLQPQSSSIRLPIWEELPRGAKFTIRLRKGIANRLWEDLVLASIGDQFSADEGCDGVVGVVLSVRAQEDVLSVWTEKSYGDGGRAIK
jgi:hypothetical protein